MQNKLVRFLPIGLTVLAMLACQLVSPSNTQEAESAPPTAGSGSITAPVGPTSENAQTPPDAKLDWFLQDTNDPSELYYCVTYTGHEASQAQWSSEFQITASDADGNKLGGSSDTVGWIFPGQSLSVVGNTHLDFKRNSGAHRCAG